MRITAKQLQDLGACIVQVRVFAKEWPDGAQLSLANCLRAVDLGLDIDWAASRLLRAPAWKVYEEATATAWKACKEAIAAAWKACKEAAAPALKAYKEATATAWKAYEEATATAFYEASLQMQKPAGEPY